MSETRVADVMWMVRGAWVTHGRSAPGCRLGVFDHLVEPRSADWLADATESDPGALTRLLRALAELGLARAARRRQLRRHRRSGRR